ISLKPFKETSDAYIQSVCQRVFKQWTPLIKNREMISIMMWSADGSELLDYSGDLDKEFEWCCYVGTANKPLLGDLPKETSPHERKQFYMENPPKMTYRILKKIVATFKQEGKKLFPDSKIRVGTTFDIGPEFAISDFKYNRHKEVVNGSGCDRLGFVDATALLNADNYRYAAYPNGIPDKTPMGTFMGKQTNIFLKDMGFDYIWLSNGMGFCYEPWKATGKIFDGKEFHAEKLKDTREKIFLFWKLFRDACPDYLIETRGTNFSVGIDYASDGVPLYDIYNGNFNITPPPNSPWAALNDNVGIEVLGQLTRNCEIPGKEYMFRYYLHDIWWMNSPWYDRYGSSPYDVYIPMALSRIDAEGKVQSPALFNILSIDNAKGNMPDQCVNESVPHFLKAEKDAPDAPSPFVLVYPFREYTTANTNQELKEMHACDTFMQDAINSGFPISTAVSGDLFQNHDLLVYKQSVLIVPAALLSEGACRILKAFSEKGGKIIAYGSDEALKTVTYSAQKINIAEGVQGLFEAIKTCGYEICHTAEENKPVMMVHKNNNAFIFSVYNRDTTEDTLLKFPLGAPVLNGFSAKIKDGAAEYRFNKCVHTECRVFVKQKGGKVRAEEQAPVNMKYRRRIKISGLEDAEVCLFGEEYCKANCMVTDVYPDATPVPQDGWKVINDPEKGTYLYGEHITGTISLCMPEKA
ncbi:MAG: hypothetical protein IKJ55_00395, partial [Clostridia bacterium]|nr:hypothetical protein [Clostridia bacterium]